MKPLRRSLFTLLAVSTLLLASGCVTQRQVRAIVADSNAAMVSPYLDGAGATTTNEAWREAVAKIDQLIAAHPNETVLVNHLKVRQAMLLTVHRQDSLATMRWEEIDREALKTERDRALYDNRHGLVWWYTRAPNRSVLAEPEIQQANTAIARLTESLESVESPDVKNFLGTVRAQLALKLDHQAKAATSEQKDALARQMSGDLKAYVDLFSPEEVAWVKDNKDSTIQAEDLSLMNTLRNRVWLRKMIKDFKATATAQEVAPAWEPEWIREY